jgi:hypothetical protein
MFIHSFQLFKPVRLNGMFNWFTKGREEETVRMPSFVSFLEAVIFLMKCLNELEYQWRIFDPELVMTRGSGRSIAPRIATLRLVPAESTQVVPYLLAQP